MHFFFSLPTKDKIEKSEKDLVRFSSRLNLRAKIKKDMMITLFAKSTNWINLDEGIGMWS